MREVVRFAHLSDWHARTLARAGHGPFRGKRLSDFVSWAISRRHTEQFFADLKDLGCEPAMVYPKASEHIPEMLEMIDGLIAKGFAYQVGGDV